MLDPYLRRAEVACQMEVDERLEVVANPQDLGQVITNILMNAADALEERAEGRRLRFATRQSGTTVVLEISNNGPEIPAAHLESIFEPFFTTKEAGKGTGLGLSISYSLMQSQGGSLRAENRAGWVVFILTLPAPRGSAEA
jgi:C4-dicarboxylate-specific signal transduction histidine kinase